MSQQCKGCGVHLTSDTIVVGAKRGRYTVRGQLPNVCGLGGMFIKAVTAVFGSLELLTGARYLGF